MGNPAFGFNSYMQFARDATWGTFPTITKRYPIYSANARAVAGRIRPQILDGTLAQPSLVKGMEMCELDLSMPLCYTGLNIIWDLIMGTATYGSNGGSSSGSDPYTHGWAGFGLLLNSGSFEIIQGGVPASPARCVRCTGMKVQRATIRVAAGIDIADQIARLDLKLIGYSLTENQTITSSLTSPTLDFVMQSHMNTLTDIAQGVTTAATLDWELVIDTMAKERPFLTGAGYISEPQREKRPNWTLTMTREFQVRTALTAFLANSGGAVQTIFSLGSTRGLQFDMTGAMATYPENPIEGEGWIKQKIVYEGQADVLGSTLAVTLTNSQATITT